MADATAQLIQALRLPAPPDVLGFSLGGMVAQALAANHSADIGAVVSGELFHFLYHLLNALLPASA